MKPQLTISAGVISISLLLAGCASTPSAEAGLSSQSDVIADTTITDALGTYSTIKWNDPTEYDQLTDEQTANASSWTNEGFSSDDALSAKQFVLNWLSNQLLDSAVLDNPDAAESFRTNTSGLIGGNIGGQKQLEEGTLVYHLPDGLKAVRDGKPRLNNVSTQYIGVEGNSDVVGGKYIVVSGTSDVTYRVTEESVLTWYKGYHPEMSDAEIRSKLNLTKGKPVTFVATINWSPYVFKSAEGDWKIAFSYPQTENQTLNGIKDLPELKPALTTSDLIGG